jgi:ribosomal protein L29
MKITTEKKDYRQKTITQLNKEIQELETKLFDLRKKLNLEKLTKTSRIYETRKKIARIKTIVYEKAKQEVLAEIKKTEVEKEKNV